MARPRKDLSDRLWRTVEIKGANDCWPCNRAEGQRGHRRISLGGRGGRESSASRVAWMLHHQLPIPDGLVVRHTCDNGWCCNPAHLLLGTPAENSRDMVERGRSARGDRNGARLHPERILRGENAINAKLTERKVRTIRRFYELRLLDQQALAEIYGVAKCTISAVVTRRNWSHVR